MATSLFTFGIPRVQVDGDDVGSFQRQKLCCALLIFVAVERAVSRERTTAVFWPDRAPDAARHTLSQTLYETRRELPDDPFETEGDRIAAAAHLWVDAVELERALDGGDTQAVCDLYAAPFLEGSYLWRTAEWEHWVDGQRARFTRLHRKAVRGRLAELSGPEHLADALATAHAWVTVDPLEDEAQHHHIRLLARSGRRTEALRQFEAHADRLRRELDVDPLDETQDLVARIRAGDPGAVSTPDAGLQAMPAASTQRADPDAHDLGPQLEHVRRIGVGSVATVYLARENALRRTVAVKVLSPDLAEDRTAILRFEREAEAAARIHHPNVVPVYWVGRTPADLPFLVMPFIRGGSLAERLDAWGPFDLPDALRTGRHIASGLSAAHRIGIIHRDVRSANILYEPETGRSMLCDFGIAAVLDELSASVRLTRTGEWLGNPSCVSPEQLLGQPVTDRTDVYGLGGLIFELLAGRSAFDATTPAELTVAHVRTEPRRLSEFRDDIPDAIVNLVDRCLAKRPEHRPGLDEIGAAFA